MGKPDFDSFLAPGYSVAQTGDESEAATRSILRSLESFRYSQFDDDAEIGRSAGSSIDQALKANGIGRSDMHAEHQRIVEEALREVSRRFQRSRLDSGQPAGSISDRDAEAALFQALKWRPSTKGAKSFPGPLIRNPTPRLNAQAQAVADGYDAGVARGQARTGSNGKGRESDKTGDVPAAPNAILDDPVLRKKHLGRLLRGPLFGELSTGPAYRMIELGFNPFRRDGTLNKDQAIDATYFGLNAPTVNRLKAAGWKVVNPRGDDVVAGGYSSRELVAGRPGRPDTIGGAARIEAQRGLFRRRTVYGLDGQGNVVGRELEPRLTADGVKAAIRDRTIQSWRSNLQARKDKREQRRLQNPFYRINRVEQVVRNERLIQLEGELRNSGGWKRRYKLLQLSILKWSLIHRGWMTLLLLTSILFVPWLGVLTWTGWALGALALTLVKFGALVLVNAYNLVASAIVSGISFLGNTISGSLEFLTGKILDNLGLSHSVCTGTGAQRTCENRLFAYTVQHVDTSYPSLPELPKPTRFDDRSLLDVVLSLFGIEFSIADQIRRILRGAP